MEIIETNLQFNSNMVERKITKRGIFHNSGTIVRQAIDIIHNYHKNTRGYAGIGYHFYIRRDGSIYRGRPENMQGAHAYGANSDSIGICFEGNLDEEYLTKEQIQAGKWLVLYLKGKYANIEFTEHRKVCNTSCPGKNFPFDEIVNSDNTTDSIENSIEISKKDIEGPIAYIQKTLNERYGLNIAIDNIYGNETRKALVKGLQEELNTQFNAGLVVDGIFGTNTYNACINVRKGASGGITWLIQAMLVCHGFNIAVDGIFGSATENVIKDLQSRNELLIDGICGKNTFSKLFR